MFYQLFNLIFSWFALANYYISFAILSNALEDDSFNLTPGITIVNRILNYFYVGLVLMCFILALGNRPQGSKVGYTLSFVGFALITIYMTVYTCPRLLFFTSTHFHLSTQVVAFLLAFKSIDALSNELQRSLTFGDIFTNRIFFNVILSMAATLGLYFVSSFLFVRVVWCFDIGWTDERLSFSSNPGICLHPLSNTYCWHHHTLTC